MKNRARPQGLAILVCALLFPAAASADQGVTDAEVVFGMTAALSGPSRDLGQQMRLGVETAFAAQNQAGGVHGRKLSLVAVDDGYEPERTKAAVRDLVERRKVFGLIGSVGTPTSAVALPYALDRGLLFFGALTGADFLRNDPPDRYVFNYRASYAEETAATVKHLVEARRVRPSQIAVFAQDDGFGDSGFEGVSYMMRRYRVDPAQLIRVSYRRNTSDVTEAVRTIRANAAKVRAVVMVATHRAAARFVQKLRDLDLVFTTVSFGGSNELAEQLVQLGPRYAEGVMVTQVVPLPTSRASFVLKYQRDLARFAPTERASFLSLEGYLAASLLIEGLQRAGRSLTTENLVSALENIKSLDVGIGTALTFGPSEHQASHKVWLTELDGQGNFRALHHQ